MSNFVVAIDGPAGSGKSSISDIVAEKLGFTHIDTGAMYRAVCLEALNRGINLENEDEYTFLDDISVENVLKHTYLNKVDVSKEIRTPIVSANVSTVSKIKAVRDKMVDFQRQSASKGNVLMDGRDIGTVVLPNANLKVFLTASVECRAQRRYKELIESGEEASLEEIEKLIAERDYKDTTRKISPLKKADDAIEVDTTKMTIEEVCNKIISMISERMNNMAEENFEELLNESYKEFKVGDKVEGTIVSFPDDKTAYVAIDGAFTEGVIHLDHYDLNKCEKFSDVAKVGDKISATVTKVEQDEYNRIYLSRLGEAKKEAASKFASDNEGKPFTVKITAKVNKGYLATAKQVKFFLPERDANGELKKGDSVEVILINFDEERGSGLVSQKACIRAKEAEEKALEFSKLNEGDIINGEIAKIEPYGLFVQFGALRGLIRLKELSHIYIENPTSKYNVGDKIEAKIISLDGGKIDLSIKALTKAPIELYAETHKVSDKVVGKVMQKLPFGVILELAEHVTGLLHKSEFSWNPNDNLMASLKIGDELEVAIITIDTEKNRIALSRKALIDNPWSRVNASKGDVIDAKVLEVTSKGLKIEALGVDGFVPVKDINLESNSSKLDAYYNVGDEVKAIITKVEPKEWILIASIKQYQDAEARAEFEKYQEKEAEKDIPTTIGDILNSKENK